MQQFDKLYIGGAWVEPSSAETIDVINASTEQVMGSIPAGTPADVDRAVVAAKDAFDGWAGTALADRVKLVQALADGIAARNQELAETMCGEVGMPIFLCQIVLAGLPQAVAASMVQIADEIVWEETIGNSIVIKEPIGVIGCITPITHSLPTITNATTPRHCRGRARRV